MGKSHLLAILIFGVFVTCFSQPAGKLPAGVKRLDDGNLQVGDIVVRVAKGELAFPARFELQEAAVFASCGQRAAPSRKIPTARRHRRYRHRMDGRRRKEASRTDRIMDYGQPDEEADESDRLGVRRFRCPKRRISSGFGRQCRHQLVQRGDDSGLRGFGERKRHAAFRQYAKASAEETSDGDGGLQAAEQICCKMILVLEIPKHISYFMKAFRAASIVHETAPLQRRHGVSRVVFSPCVKSAFFSKARRC